MNKGGFLATAWSQEDAAPETPVEKQIERSEVILDAETLFSLAGTSAYLSALVGRDGHGVRTSADRMSQASASSRAPGGIIRPSQPRKSKKSVKRRRQAGVATRATR